MLGDRVRSQAPGLRRSGCLTPHPHRRACCVPTDGSMQQLAASFALFFVLFLCAWVSVNDHKEHQPKETVRDALKRREAAPDRQEAAAVPAAAPSPRGSLRRDQTPTSPEAPVAEDSEAAVDHLRGPNDDQDVTRHGVDASPAAGRAAPDPATRRSALPDPASHVHRGSSSAQGPGEDRGPGASGGNGTASADTVDVVIARCTESLQWVGSYFLPAMPPRYRVTVYVYNKCRHPDFELRAANVRVVNVHLPNVGFESHSYLHHILRVPRYAAFNFFFQVASWGCALGKGPPLPSAPTPRPPALPKFLQRGKLKSCNRHLFSGHFWYPPPPSDPHAHESLSPIDGTWAATERRSRAQRCETAEGQAEWNSRTD